MSDTILLILAVACCVLIVARAGDSRVLALVAGLLILAVLVDGAPV